MKSKTVTLVQGLRELAERAYDGHSPGISAYRAALVSQGADEIERLTEALRKIRDSGNWVHPLGAALVAIAVDTIGPHSSAEPGDQS
jgi:hypothetical protein